MYSYYHPSFLLIHHPQVQSLTLTNPSHHPVMIQPVLLHHYPHPQKIFQVFFESGSLEMLDFSRASSFKLHTHHNDASPTHYLMSPDEGKKDMKLKIQFSAVDSRGASTLLVIRNNLTVLEYVVIQGKGLEGPFTIGGIQPETSPLLFQFVSSDLESCEGLYLLIASEAFSSSEINAPMSIYIVRPAFWSRGRCQIKNGVNAQM